MEFPNIDGNPYKSSGGTTIFNSNLKKDIPNDWIVKKLSELCSLYLGGTPSTSNEEYWGGDISWLNSGEIAQFPVVMSELKITKLGLDNSATKLMKAGTVVVSITGNIRASILAFDACANQSVVGIEENELLQKEYLYPYVFNQLKYFTAISTGNCQKHINKGTLEDSFILIPPSDVLHAYYDKVQPIYSQIISLAKENQELISLRNHLLPMLMNGQVTIED